MVSGHREWQLALRKLDKSEKITCQIVTVVDKNIKDKYFPELSNVSQLAKVIDLRRTSFYPPSKAGNESEVVPFEDLLRKLPNK